MRHAAGFTLLEMIVVLIIASLAMMLGFQSLTQWQRAQESLSRVTQDTRRAGLVQAWWRESSAGATPILEKPFKGATGGFEGFTLSPVFGVQGSTTPFSWKLEARDGKSQLVLIEDGVTHAFPLPLGREPRFSYVSKDGRISDKWPMALGKGEEDTNLPAMIRLTFHPEDEDTSQVWIANIVGTLEPIYKPAKLEED